MKTRKLSRRTVAGAAVAVILLVGLTNSASAQCTEVQKLSVSDLTPYDAFGYSVSLSGETALVGALGECAAGRDCGSAYVFRFNGTSWVEEQKLTGSDAETFDYFGTSVSVSGDTALVGALWDSCAAGRSCGLAGAYKARNQMDEMVWVAVCRPV